MTEGYIGEMNGNDGVGVAARELFRDCTAPISTMRSKLRRLYRARE